MSDLTETEALAAEYVLGTLDRAERAHVDARRSREPELETAIAAWEGRLGVLAQSAPPMSPPSDLLPKIERRIAASAASAGSVVDFDSSQAMAMRRRMRRWRASALAASALAASLMIGLFWRETTRSGLEQNYVAVFQKDDAAPAFLLTVDLATRTLSIRRVAADVPAGKTYQLWIAAEQLGQGPQSLGLVENRDVQLALSKIDPKIVQSALFGVSLEPAGGSPTGKPTGPVFHAHLIPSL